MATIDIKYLTQPHDGTPGTSWDDFEERILSVAAGNTDDRGWSLADTFIQRRRRGRPGASCLLVDWLSSDSMGSTYVVGVCSYGVYCAIRMTTMDIL